MIAQETNQKIEFDRFAASYRELHNASIAITGETGEYFADYKAKFVAAELAADPRRRILDYGCGVGMVCSQLKKQLPLARIDGFDVSLPSLDQVDAELRSCGVFTSDISNLGSCYDAVLLANVLHHVEPKDRQATVSNAAGLLKRGGKLMIFEHNPANPLTRRAVERCPFDENAILLRPQESVGYVSGSGLGSIAIRYIVFFPHAARWLRPLEPFLGWCPAGAQYCVVGNRL